MISLVTCRSGERLALSAQVYGDMGVEATISDGVAVWKSEGLISYENRPAIRKNEPQESYLSTLSAAFQPTAEILMGLSNYKFDYEAERNNGQLTFTVKQQAPEGSHFMILCKTNFNASPDPASAILDLFASANETLQAKDVEMGYLRDDVDFFRKDVDRLTEDAHHFVVWKEELQNRLMERFCAVLNSKKREIARLESLLAGGRGKSSGSSKLPTVKEEEEDDNQSVASSTVSNTKRRGASKPPATRKPRGKKATEDEEEAVALSVAAKASTARTRGVASKSSADKLKGNVKAKASSAKKTAAPSKGRGRGKKLVSESEESEEEEEEEDDSDEEEESGEDENDGASEMDVDDATEDEEKEDLVAPRKGRGARGKAASSTTVAISTKGRKGVPIATTTPQVHKATISVKDEPFEDDRGVDEDSDRDLLGDDDDDALMSHSFSQRALAQEVDSSSIGQFLSQSAAVDVQPVTTGKRKASAAFANDDTDNEADDWIGTGTTAASSSTIGANISNDNSSGNQVSLSQSTAATTSQISQLTCTAASAPSNNKRKKKSDRFFDSDTDDE